MWDDAGLDVGDGCGAGAFDADGVAVDVRVETENGDFVLAGLVTLEHVIDKSINLGGYLDGGGDLAHDGGLFGRESDLFGGQFRDEHL